MKLTTAVAATLAAVTLLSGTAHAELPEATPAVIDAIESESILHALDAVWTIALQDAYAGRLSAKEKEELTTAAHAVEGAVSAKNYTKARALLYRITQLVLDRSKPATRA